MDNVECKYYVPNQIINIIISYYPQKYLIYAIGQDRNGFSGLWYNEQLNEFEKLASWTFYCDNTNFIYYNMARFILKTKFNKMHCAGRNECGELGLGIK